MRARGRPSEFTQAVANAICAELAAGKSLREICRADGMPAHSTVRGWVIDDREGFAAQYARARELQAEHWADEIIEISDDGTNDWVERKRKDGTVETALDNEHVNRSRLRVDSRKWLLSKLLPKKYGERVTQEISGPEGGPIPVDDLAMGRWVAFKLESAR